MKRLIAQLNWNKLINIHILFNFTKLFIWKGINNEIFNHWICKVDKDRRRRPTTSKTIINKSDGKELISFLKQGIVDLNPSCKKYSKEMSNSINIQVSKYTLSKQTRGAPPSPLQVSSGPYNIWELVFKNKTIHMFKLLVFFLFKCKCNIAFLFELKKLTSTYLTLFHDPAFNSPWRELWLKPLIAFLTWHKRQMNLSLTRLSEGVRSPCSDVALISVICKLILIQRWKRNFMVKERLTKNWTRLWDQY